MKTFTQLIKTKRQTKNCECKIHRPTTKQEQEFYHDTGLCLICAERGLI